MNSKALLLKLLPLSVLSGCVLGDPLEYGDACPGLDVGGTLNYIENRQTCSAEQAYQCTFDDQLDEDGNRISFDFSTYFNKRYCPPQYSKCKKDTVQDAETKQDFTFYHCEKDTRTRIECANEQFRCKVSSENGENTGDEEGEFECIDPGSTNTCGASTCNADDNYGGVNCYLYNRFSTCNQNQEGKYVCLCASGALQCKEECIDPSSKITCGANDCSKENYGGDDCTEYEDNRTCEQDSDGNFRCVCREGDILCNGKCITPESNVEHCGARGLCNDLDSDSDNYSGANCGSGGDCDDGVCQCNGDKGILCDDRCISPEISNDHCGAKGLCNDPDSQSEHYVGTDCGLGGFCHDGKCECYEGIWCLDEQGNGQCLMPPGHETCNAHHLDDGLHCEYTECKLNELCIAESETTYRCEVMSCDETKENLCVVDGKNACVSKLDTNHCQNCDNDCANHSFPNIKSFSCTDKAGTPTCTYVCTDSTINCGTDTAPNCVNTNTDYNYCGGCHNKCQGNQFCHNGTCQYTTCQSTECTVMNGNTQSCINQDTQCGSNCKSCKSIHATGYCDNGSCFIHSCSNGQHPVYNSAGKITQCANNTPTSCAPSNLGFGQSVTDCNKSKPSTATGTGCDPNGQCYITGCSSGYHLASDKKSCKANTDTQCGPSEKNCNNWKPANAASAKCNPEKGTCYVKSCNNGYHIASDLNSCVKNTSSSCGAKDSTKTKSCSSPQTYCNNGSCECPDGKKLNYDKNSCVIPECAGIPGVKEGKLLTKSWYNKNISDNACNPTKCNSKYKQESQAGEGKYFSCRPPTSMDCSKLGYKYSEGGYCVGRKNGKNGHAHCNTGYRQYILACIDQDLCCGTRNADMSNSLDYVCRNCKSQGKKCDISSGKCK